jgi:predicted Zn-dependent protease
MLPSSARTDSCALQYETKKYKLGLKTADAILKKFPEAGETLCMKGLILATMEQRAEGLELARKGVRHDIGSFLAWHALGILQRMDKNWNEAVKCYSMALRIEGVSASGWRLVARAVADARARRAPTSISCARSATCTCSCATTRPLWRAA